MTGLLLLLVAAGLLWAGAELFVENAAASARRLGVTVLAVGVLLAGAEPEEMLTGVVAALRDRPDLAAGDAIGANLTMLTASLGLAAVIRPLPMGHRVREYAAVSAGAGLLALAVLAGGHVSRPEGLLLVAGYVALVATIWWREREPPVLGELAELDEGERGGDDQGQRGERETSPTAGLVRAVVGIGLMLLGGQVAVTGAGEVVDALGQTDTAVGLTLLALATTAELFALVLAAARRDVAEIAVAGVVGSAAYNATASLGAAALARPLTVSGMTAPAAAAAALPLLVVGLARHGRLGRAAGLLLCATYVVYVVVVFRR